MIWFSCNKCGKALGRSDASAGALVFCDCGQGNTVPWESTREAPAAPPPAAAAPVPPPLPPPLLLVPVSEEQIPIVRPGPSARPGDKETPARDWRAPRDPARCFNHQDRPIQEICLGCGESFCGDCLVKFKGQPLCGPCKNFRLREATKPAAVSGKAVVAVVLSMVFAPLAMCMVPMGIGTASLIVCGLALLGQLAAIVLGVVALKETEQNQRLAGRSLAITTLLTGGLACLVTAFLMLMGQR